jgi:hypothetical protein
MSKLLLWIRAAIWRFQEEAPIVRLTRIIERHSLAPRSFALTGKRLVNRYSTQPRSELRFTPKLIDFGAHQQESFLNNILSVLPMSCDAKSDLEDSPAVLRRKYLESIGLAGLRLFYYIHPVVGCHAV